jgi:hypothetical protein
VYAAALADWSRMLNGVGHQFVHDECKRHRRISGNDERIGIDD